MEKVFELITSGNFWGSVLTSTVVVTIINIIWKYTENKITFKNSRQLQVDNYYREASGAKMHKILDRWSEMLFLLDKPSVKNKMQNKQYVQKLLQETYLYSSFETCRRLANYQQYAYKNEGNLKDNHHEVLVLVAGIITSLKHDFTGEWVSIQETLRVKLTDYEENKKGFKKEMRKYKYKK